jgi:small GTP-binding protein
MSRYLFSLLLLYTLLQAVLVLAADNTSYTTLKNKPIKVVLLGPASAGKTTLLHRLLHEQILTQSSLHKTPATIGAAFTAFPVTPTMTLHFWDTAGEERFASLARVYARGAQAAIFVYDVADRESFGKMVGLMERMREAGELRWDECLVLVVGTKLDLVADKSVEDGVRKEEAEAVLTGNGYRVHRFLEMSAMAPSGDTSFELVKRDILMSIIDYWERQQSIAIGDGDNNNGGIIYLEENGWLNSEGAEQCSC